MELLIRPASAGDREALGRFGAALAGQHHGFDRERFMLPPDVEEGYRWWLGKEAEQPDAVVLIAEKDGRPVGYAYGRLQPADWNLLLDACGAFHDLWVEPSARGLGAGRQLAEAMIERLTALGAPRIVLHTASANPSARRLFARLGFRETMVEMTREG